MLDKITAVTARRILDSQYLPHMLEAKEFLALEQWNPSSPRALVQNAHERGKPFEQCLIIAASGTMVKSAAFVHLDQDELSARAPT